MLSREPGKQPFGEALDLVVDIIVRRAAEAEVGDDVTVTDLLLAVQMLFPDFLGRADEVR